MSDSFAVSNGVRQGGILSPYLFCVYMDDLSKKLNNVDAGCFMGTALINNLMYADDHHQNCKMWVPYGAHIITHPD